MYVARPAAGQWIAMYDENRRLLGTFRLSIPKNGRGRIGVVFDVPDRIRFDPDYEKKDKQSFPKVAPVQSSVPPYRSGAAGSFGDYEYPDISVPFEADNEF